MATETKNTNEGAGKEAPAPQADSLNYIVLSPDGLDMNAALTPIIDKDVIKAIKTAIGGDRKEYPTHEAALEALQAGMEKTNSYAGLPVISYREEAFTDEMVAIVACIGVRVKEQAARKETLEDGTIKEIPAIPATNGIRGILIFPMPTLDAFLGDEVGKNWVNKLREREAADVGFSGIRAAESVLSLCNAVGRMPITVEAISRESNANSIDTSLFDDNWQAFKDAFVAKNQAFAADGMFPAKPLWLKAIRSKSFAAEHPSTKALEERGYIVTIANLFVKTLKAAKHPETKEPLNLDTSTIEGWILDREKLDLSTGAKPDASALDNLALNF